MSGLIRKALIIKAQSGKPSEHLAKNFAVLKYERSASGTTIEFQSNAIISQTECDLLLFNGKNSICFHFIAQSQTDKVNFFIKADYETDFGLCAAIFTANNPAPLLFGSNLSAKITISEIIEHYEKTVKKTFTHYEQSPTAILAEKKDFCRTDNERQNYTLTDESQNPILADDLQIHEYTESDIKENDTNENETDKSEYDDEALATENYFSTEYQAREYKINQNEVYHDNLLSQISDTEKRTQNDGKKAESKLDAEQNETTFSTCPFRKIYPEFYAEKREDIEELLHKYPPIGSLSQYIPQSRWVKIPYKKDGFYIIGVIDFDNVPQYIVYGVPGTRETHPRGFDRYSIFLPESLFSTSNAGFWCSFQSAKDGKIVYPS